MCVVLGAESTQLFAKETVPRHHSRGGHSGQICLSKRDICDPCQLWFAQTSYRPDVPCLPSLRPTTCLDGPTLLAARKKLGVRVGFGVVRLREDAAVRWPPQHSCRALQSCVQARTAFDVSSRHNHCFISRHACMIQRVCRMVERVTADLIAGMRPSTAVALCGNSQEEDGQGGFRRQG